MPYGVIKFNQNCGSGNDLVPYGTKPLSEPMLFYNINTFVWTSFFHSRQANPTHLELLGVWPFVCLWTASDCGWVDKNGLSDSDHKVWALRCGLVRSPLWLCVCIHNSGRKLPAFLGSVATSGWSCRWWWEADQCLEYRGTWSIRTQQHTEHDILMTSAGYRSMNSQRTLPILPTRASYGTSFVSILDQKGSVISERESRTSFLLRLTTSLSLAGHHQAGYWTYQSDRTLFFWQNKCYRNMNTCLPLQTIHHKDNHIDGLMQKRCNSSALAMEQCLKLSKIFR